MGWLISCQFLDETPLRVNHGLIFNAWLQLMTFQSPEKVIHLLNNGLTLLTKLDLLLRQNKTDAVLHVTCILALLLGFA